MKKVILTFLINIVSLVRENERKIIFCQFHI